MSNKPKRIDAIYQHNSQLNQLAKRSRKLTQLDIILQQIIPDQFVAHCHLANINEHTVIVHTDNAAYASLLRFQADTVCKTLSEHIPQMVTKLVVKVRPTYIPLQSQPPPTANKLPHNAAIALQQTADTMEPSALKTALEKLCHHGQKKTP